MAVNVMNDADLVLTEIRDRSAVITLNRPARLNAIDVPMLLALERAIDACEADDNVRVIIVTGAGDKAFMAGGDIAGLNSRQGLAHYVRILRPGASCVPPAGDVRQARPSARSMVLRSAAAWN